MTKNIIITDLMGTILDSECNPIEETITILSAMRGQGFEVEIFTAKPERYREEVLRHIGKTPLHDCRLAMRQPEDILDDIDLKAYWAGSRAIDLARTFCIFENDRKIIKMFRRHGFTVYGCKEI